MTDFIDVLEQQLVAAHGRPRRRFALPPWRATIVFAGAAAAAAVVVIAVLALSSPTQQPAAGSPPTTQPPQTTPVHPPPPLTLAVLNGTTTTGLARAVADELTSFGYPEPNVVTNDTTNPTRALTAVYYEAGHRDDALSVADCLKLGHNRVHSMDPEARALADRADVAIFVGADRAP
jgi:LytR cell envelope-related transcriptional attenuator